MVEARRFFDSLAEKNVVVWTTLFSGYVKARQYEARTAMHPKMEIHAYMLKMGLDKIFQSVAERDTILHNVMISGYAQHGHEIKAIQLFEEMLRNGIKPDMVMVLEILSTCRHCDLGKLAGEGHRVHEKDSHRRGSSNLGGNFKCLWLMSMQQRETELTWGG
ncbi:hypothetical protein Patl1_20241 [Pistacia atlantica]|uniref:Uncharacterized protein n=1 Tax=Pistacia atlantica TaxID=434234 RepID=A0ACC1BLK6_9ROSI|nr:hypothetical protein Patl1_20241 [Pistacia atlantica]